MKLVSTISERLVYFLFRHLCYFYHFRQIIRETTRCIKLNLHLIWTTRKVSIETQHQPIRQGASGYDFNRKPASVEG